MNGQPADVQRRTYNRERATDKGPVNEGRVRDRNNEQINEETTHPSEESYSRQPLLFGLDRPAHDEDRAIEDTKGALDLDREVDVACTATGLTPCHVCTGTGLTAATSAPGLGSPLPHLHRDWADPCHICTGTGLTPATSALGLGSPLPHLHWDWALRRHRNAWRTRVGVRWWRRKWGCDSARETANARSESVAWPE